MTPKSSLTCFWEHLLDTPPPQTALWAFLQSNTSFKEREYSKSEMDSHKKCGDSKEDDRWCSGVFYRRLLYSFLSDSHCNISSCCMLKVLFKLMNGFPGWSREQRLGSTRAQAQWHCHLLLQGSPSCSPSPQGHTGHVLRVSELQGWHFTKDTEISAPYQHMVHN